LTLSAPQRQHVERCADLLVVAPRRQTLAQLAAVELPGVDPSNLADFFRISPWDPEDLRLPLVELVLRYLKTHNPGQPLPIYRKLTQWHHDLKGCSYGRVSLELANGRRRTYWVRSITWRLRGVPGAVRVVLSQKGPGVRAPKYFLCTDLTLYGQEILSRYQQRWGQEVDYWYVKQELGLGDFRLQSYEAIEEWYAVVYLTLVYLYWRRYEEGEAHGHTPSLSEVVTGIRRDHQREVPRAACEEVAAGTPVEAVLGRYLGGARPQAA
jgi:hypothetical protein